MVPLALAALTLTTAVATAVASPTPLSQSELDTLVERIHSADPGSRLEAAQKIAAAGPEAMELLAHQLSLPPKNSIDTFRRIVLATWGQVPNWKSGDPMWIAQPEPARRPPPRVKGQPRPQRPPPHDPETLDWLTALNDLDLTKPAALDVDKLIPVEKGQKMPEPSPTPSPAPIIDWAEARAEAMERVALIRGIAGSRRLDAVDPLFKLAFELDGVFRDECGRQIRSMDSYAVPRLIRLMHQTGPVALRLGKQRRYAAYQLDRMDRQRPSKAISTAPDDLVRAEIIHAYGEEHALDAVEAILGQVDSASHRVRKEARWAWLGYVSGKLPPPAPKRKRKLPGGREEDEEKPDYLTYREIATLALQKQLGEIQGAPVDAKKSAAQLTDELFAYYDARHAAEWDAQFEAAREKESHGDWQGATDGYGWILAHDPNYLKRAQMAHAFARMGDALAGRRELSRAVGYYRQAVDLDPVGVESRAAGARVLMCDGLLAGDAALLRRALSLDPSLDEARTGLQRAESARRRRHWLQAGASLGVICFVLFGLWALRRRRQ